MLRLRFRIVAREAAMSSVKPTGRICVVLRSLTPGWRVFVKSRAFTLVRAELGLSGHKGKSKKRVICKAFGNVISQSVFRPLFLSQLLWC